jgi:hypothetical protein
MAFSAYPTSGKTLEMNQETALGTVSFTGSEFIRYNDFTSPDAETDTTEQSNLGHAHAANFDDPVIPYEVGRDNSITLTTEMRAGTQYNYESPIDWLFQASGHMICGRPSMSPGNYSSWTSGTEFTIHADPSAYPTVLINEVDDGDTTVYWPTLVAEADGSDITPSFEVPYEPTTPGNNAVYEPYSICPCEQAVPSNKTLGLRLTTHATHTSGRDNAKTHSGCAVSSLGEIAIEQGVSPKLQWTLHCADTEHSSNAIATETFLDTQRTAPPVGGKYWEVAFADTDDEGGIAASGNTLDVISARINLGVNCVPIPGSGGSGVNSYQGFVQDNNQATVSLTVLFDRALFDDLSAQTNQEKYIHFIRGATSEQTPCWGIWLPRCRQISNPVINMDGGFQTMTLTYGASAAQYASTSDDGGYDDRGYAPWYFCCALGKHVDP